MHPLNMPLVLVVCVGLVACPTTINAEVAARSPVTAVLPADCSRPAGSQDLGRHILCTAKEIARLAWEIDETVEAVRKVMLPDERASFEQEHTAWQAGNATACRTEVDATTNADREPEARDCLRKRFSNRVPAIWRLLASKRRVAMQECETAAHAQRALTGPRRNDRPDALTVRYGTARQALQYLSTNLMVSAAEEDRGDPLAAARVRVAAEGAAAMAAGTRTVLAACDRLEQAYRARTMAGPGGRTGDGQARRPVQSEPLIALLPSPVRALCDGLPAARRERSLCLLLNGASYYEGRIVEAEQKIIARSPLPIFQTAASHWRQYRNAQCAWRVANLDDARRDEQHDRCLLTFNARRDVELREELAVLERGQPPSPRPVAVVGVVLANSPSRQ